MKPYKRYFTANSLLKEGIQKPERYLDLLLNKIDELKKDIRNKDISAPALCKYLSNQFVNDKIIFEFIPNSNIKSDAGILKANYNVDTNNIKLLCDFELEQIQYNDEDFSFFKDDFSELVGHELTHRLQFVKDKVKIVKDYNIETKEGLIEYLSDKKEIMVHAWQIVQAFKLLGASNENILSFLKIKNNHIAKFNYVLAVYQNNFDITSPVLKKLYKYIYLYAE